MKTHLVFDLDGTLSDTQKIHERIESDFLKEYWVFIEPKTIGSRFAGRTPQEWISEVLSAEQKEFSWKYLETFVSQKDQIVLNALSKWEIELMPFAHETLQYLVQKWYKIGISSWACREFIDAFIVYFHLQEIILVSTSANEVKNKKPHPDVYQASFDKLVGLDRVPDTTYVIGDWWSDVVGWHHAGAKTVWLNAWHKPKPDVSICDYEIETLKDLQHIF